MALPRNPSSSLCPSSLPQHFHALGKLAGSLRRRPITTQAEYCEKAFMIRCNNEPKQKMSYDLPTTYLLSWNASERDVLPKFTVHVVETEQPTKLEECRGFPSVMGNPVSASPFGPSGGLPCSICVQLAVEVQRIAAAAEALRVGPFEGAHGGNRTAQPHTVQSLLCARGLLQRSVVCEAVAAGSPSTHLNLAVQNAPKQAASVEKTAAVQHRVKVIQHKAVAREHRLSDGLDVCAEEAPDRAVADARIVQRAPSISRSFPAIVLDHQGLVCALAHPFEGGNPAPLAEERPQVPVCQPW
eukprot:CAMPEP_0179017998 /NCGR_PEP_ID=MMETSP0796-20121207/4127_1 /TAXON_ID=73915 /ORGANISM="Pyrodinium bahamense, Strain pbaha01" /LENGTH=298 /DNA_ID=CAMNT_0020713743 /DNA_START=12 /DNA_END=909 /DNA_ORIENTATION=+